MAKLTPYIVSEDARAQAAFYAEALGGDILSVSTHSEMPNTEEALKDKVLHLSMVAAGIPIYMCDTVYAPLQGGNQVSLSLEFASEAEARKAFAGLSEGGTVTHPLEQAFWGSLFGQLVDRFGVRWMISTEAQAAS